jgi:predicted HicB family RNase H-like nuclease
MEKSEKTRASVTLTAEMRRALRIEAAKEGVSMGAIVQRVLERYIKAGGADCYNPKTGQHDF